MSNDELTEGNLMNYVTFDLDGYMGGDYTIDKCKAVLRSPAALNSMQESAVKDMMLRSLGLHDHPRRDKAWHYAWDYGHSAGYTEVYGYLMDMADVLGTI